MEYQEYIIQKKELYSILIQFIENRNDEDYFQNLINIIETQKILENPKELKLLINLILNISNNHHRSDSFMAKIEQILLYLENQIKQTFANFEIFELVKNNRLNLLFFITNKIIIIDSILIEYLRHSQLLHFFYPEVKNLIENQEIEKIENERKEYEITNFEEIRKIGENDSYFCQIIRNDLIDDFVIYFNKVNLSISSKIKKSIFETNPLLLKEEELPIIEYAAFFGSIQILRFLYLNGAKLNPFLWTFAIHSNNAEMIHFLEENNVDPPIEKCIIEAIKCHHNDIARYIINKFSNEEEIQKNNKILKSIFHHFNFDFFPNEFNVNFIFYNLFQYDYVKLLNLYLKTKEHEQIIDKNGSILLIYFFEWNFII
ncbi:hypothetical protein M9Y10_043763 [Tritrichomonas musculus]|uniref:DUF3447 domain-containing protein n=1 Tax=Tritrichomonas musculus TaxID=1915356 RepID=A0ABR2K3I2_9EUKA